MEGFKGWRNTLNLMKTLLNDWVELQEKIGLVLEREVWRCIENFPLVHACLPWLPYTTNYKLCWRHSERSTGPYTIPNTRRVDTTTNSVQTTEVAVSMHKVELHDWGDGQHTFSLRAHGCVINEFNGTRKIAIDNSLKAQHNKNTRIMEDNEERKAVDTLEREEFCK